jgi:putative hydrolase of the HAD superfamily
MTVLHRKLETAFFGSHGQVPLDNLRATIKAGNLKALIVDVDGTLNRQGPVRCAMFWRLLCAHLGNPAGALSTVRLLRAYRTAQESLRGLPLIDGDLATVQLRLACKCANVKPEVVTSTVVRWMEREPLRFLSRSLRDGVMEFLKAAVDQGLRLGVVSDYPAVAKLQAMGMAHFFDVIVTAQDPEVQAFKPNPRGLKVALERLGVTKHEAVYIGDRPDVDVSTASSAGLACVIMGRRNVVDRRGWIEISSYRDLLEVICYRR